MRNFGVEFTSFNNPDLRIHSQPAVNAISTARALADLHMKAFDGTLLSDNFVETLKEPSHPNKFDRTLGERQDKGKGFFYTKSPLDTWQIGHFGVGGQIVRYDFENQLSIAYLCNGMKIGVHKYVETYNRLERRIYESFKLKH
ncbi:hypothetical protein WR25_19032 isoform A [Diploscapter pachys]|uniref:Beta-lactamase-related domain-containing protein n=1 Tax=Diploscapter pachys TaxID=2018661 RepID=A0A2A2JJL3_9BILA|nr:hypothetical protein WR25_19032 isoform A [Diploscapter pachys]